MTVFSLTRVAVTTLLGVVVLISCTGDGSRTSRLDPAIFDGPIRPMEAQANVIVLAKSRKQLDPRRLVRVQISPSYAIGIIGKKFIFTAVALDERGAPAKGITLNWEVTDPRVGSIDHYGVFTTGSTVGVFENSVRVTASQDSVSVTSTSSVEVVEELASARRTMAILAVYPTKVIALPGQIVGLGALGWDNQSRFVPNVQFTWKMKDPLAGQIDQLGFLKVTKSPGTYEDAVELTGRQVTAEGGERVLTVTVSVEVSKSQRLGIADNLVVLPSRITAGRNQPVSLVARAFDSTGTPLPRINFEWKTVDRRAGSFTEPGRFTTGNRAGEYRKAILVIGRFARDTAMVELSTYVDVVIKELTSWEDRGELVTAQILPAVATLSPGERLIFGARGLDREGKPVRYTANWSLANNEAGHFDDRGVYTAPLEPGIYPRVVRLELSPIGTAEGKRTIAYASVYVLGPLAKVEIIPATIELESGSSWTLRAVGLDANGLELDRIGLRWTVTDPQAGSIDRMGVFVAGNRQGKYEDAVLVEAVELD